MLLSFYFWTYFFFLSFHISTLNTHSCSSGLWAYNSIPHVRLRPSWKSRRHSPIIKRNTHIINILSVVIEQLSPTYEWISSRRELNNFFFSHLDGKFFWFKLNSILEFVEWKTCGIIKKNWKKVSISLSCVQHSMHIWKKREVLQHRLPTNVMRKKEGSSSKWPKIRNPQNNPSNLCRAASNALIKKCLENTFLKYVFNARVAAYTGTQREKNMFLCVRQYACVALLLRDVVDNIIIIMFVEKYGARSLDVDEGGFSSFF